MSCSHCTWLSDTIFVVFTRLFSCGGGLDFIFQSANLLLSCTLHVATDSGNTFSVRVQHKPKLTSFWSSSQFLVFFIQLHLLVGLRLGLFLLRVKQRLGPPVASCLLIRRFLQFSMHTTFVFNSFLDPLDFSCGGVLDYISDQI